MQMQNVKMQNMFAKVWYYQFLGFAISGSWSCASHYRALLNTLYVDIIIIFPNHCNPITCNSFMDS